jgi:hypothetical protein
MSEQVNHPSHYNQIQGVECIDVVEQMPFNLGNSIKYIWRCGDKGNKVQDLQKAIWYLEREIDRTRRLEKSLPIEETIREVCQHFVPAQLDCDRCSHEPNNY